MKIRKLGASGPGVSVVGLDCDTSAGASVCRPRAAVVDKVFDVALRYSIPPTFKLQAKAAGLVAPLETVVRRHRPELSY